MLLLPETHEKVRPADPYGLAYRWHPTKGWQFWTASGWSISGIFSHRTDNPARGGHGVTTYNTTWAEPEADE